MCALDCRQIGRQVSLAWVIIFFWSRSCNCRTYNVLALARRLVRAKKVANSTAGRPHKCLLVQHLDRCKLGRVKLRRDARHLLSSCDRDTRNHSLFLLRL